jgi:hypothetical protein
MRKRLEAAFGSEDRLSRVPVGRNVAAATDRPVLRGAPRPRPKGEAMRPQSDWPPGCFPRVAWDEGGHRRQLGEVHGRLRPLGVEELVRLAVEAACVYEATAAMEMLLREARDAFDRVVEAFETAYDDASPRARCRIECCLAWLVLPPEEVPSGG